MRISAINIYPIKGCRATPVESVEVDRLGPVGDRRLMLVDDGGQFISQRENAALATIVPVRREGALEVRAPGQSAFHLSIDPEGPPRTVSVWGNTGIRAVDQGDASAAWFSGAIGMRCRLVYFGAASHNPVDPDFSPRPDAETAFTDGYPIMAALHESLLDLNSRLQEPVPMERFRPTIVVEGAGAWSEDAWRMISLGDLVCDVVKPCARCSVTTTDQVTGARHERQEPLRTLATFRTIPGVGAIFGQNLVPRGTGALRVGDSASAT